MANNPQITNAAASVAADAVLALVNTGYLRLYDAPQPATADTAISTQTLLAELRFGASAFAAASNGAANANAITSDPSANATGDAAWFRALKSDGTTVVFDGTVGTSGADLNLGTVSIVAGSVVSVTSLIYTQSKT